MTTAMVLEGMSVPDFVEHILNHTVANSTLIVCGSKEDFLEQLRSATLPAFGHPTLRRLAAAQSTAVTFCPGVTHLRAYLATLLPKPHALDSGTAVLALLNPIALHKATPEFSAQGLNRSFALAFEAASRTMAQLILSESPCPDDAQTDDNPWDEQVSILHVGSRTSGPTELGWLGRTVPVRKVASRWFTFERPPQAYSGTISDKDEGQSENFNPR
ncbi:hypothetical protein K470DRAFT_257532 [Piedraia hortae CBS 480.64]|uniref:Uncharacterized protein n=1 Tax=Piedraia hortae CBS 480.64 TaxID=1314780 RepID=A0A6A7C036_9PEZI|nr:hypothetical protein K470DRAFT_257532 [Piedraia hortae CBS 480.64]